VRELENLLHRALALAAGPSIGIEDLGLPDIGFDDTGTEAGAPGWSGPGSAAPPVAPLASAPAAADTISAEPPLPTDLVAYLDEVERQVLQRALERHRYNRTAAGAGLGLSLRQMRYRMARLGIGGEQAAAEPDGN
jgi:two-component system response regulator PilR (NtrC family)